MSSELRREYRIVVIEDNAADVHLIGHALRKAGLTFDLTVIEDGAGAMAFAGGEGSYAGAPKPDLLILDLNLPQTNGIEVLAAIRRNDALEGVPIAVVTSSSAPVEKSRASELHVQRFITKPPDLEDFLAIGAELKELLEP